MGNGNDFARLQKRLTEKKAVLGVVGLGYVGLPLAVAMAQSGYRVYGFDVSETKVSAVNNASSYIGDVTDEELSALIPKESSNPASQTGNLNATTDFSHLAEVDCVCIAVPTPLDAHQQPDISHVEAAAHNLLPYLHEGMLVVLESTTYPYTTQGLLLPLLESGGLTCGEDFCLAFSPERVDPGNSHYRIMNTPKVVGGVTPLCTSVAACLYENVLQASVIRVSSPAVAEMEKILENAYRNINIGLINELAILCNRMGISIWEVIEAAKTKPYGFQAFYPGLGPGGHCIPLDPCYLSWKAREYKFHTSMIEASMAVNDSMPEYCVQRVTEQLNHYRKPLRGSKILMLGIAYKKDCSDYRESPALRVFERLLAQGADVSYYDPYVKSFCDRGINGHSAPELTAQYIEGFDLVIIAVKHSRVDYALVVDHAHALFDAVNATDSLGAREWVEVL